MTFSSATTISFTDFGSVSGFSLISFGTNISFEKFVNGFKLGSIFLETKELKLVPSSFFGLNTNLTISVKVTLLMDIEDKKSILNKDRIWIRIKNYIYLCIFLIILVVILLLSNVLLSYFIYKRLINLN